MSNSGFPSLNNTATSTSGALEQRLSVDVQGVNALRHAVRSSPVEGMKQASKQFEVMFMQMVLKSMRDATPSDGMFSSQQEKMYTSMLDQQLSQNLSGRGLGLAASMFTQLSRTMAGDAALLPAANGPVNAPANGLPAAAQPVMPLNQELKTAPGALPPVSRAADLSFYDTASGQSTTGRSVSPQAHVEQFVSRMLPAAQQASEASGVPAQLIMAQAALESGWGRREIRAEDGRNSFNLFGIKADKSWKGPVVETTTTEYVSGSSQKTRATFRAYGSYEESFSDYAQFLSSNPRYANVVATQDPAQAAHGLQRAGYATDPQYGGKLIRIMKQMT